MQIQFKLIPVRYQGEKSEYLVKGNSFLTVPISRDYASEIQEVLNKEFGGGVIARSIWVENTDKGLNIYTLIGDIESEQPGYKWVADLDSDKFDEYDKTAIEFLKLRETWYKD